MGCGDSGQVPISPSPGSGPSLSCSGWLADRKWSGWDRNSARGPLGGALEPDQDTQEPGDESWTQEKREGAQHLLRFFYLLGLPWWLGW